MDWEAYGRSLGVRSKRSKRRVVYSTGFLIWIQRFVGPWEFEGTEYEIARTADGWLASYDEDRRRRHLIDRLIEHGRRRRTHGEVDVLLSTLDKSPTELQGHLFDRCLTRDEQVTWSTRPEARKPLLFTALERWRELQLEEKRNQSLSALAAAKPRIRHSKAERAAMAQLHALWRQELEADMYDIPRAFVWRAQCHIEKMGEPLFEYRHRTYTTTYQVLNQELHIEEIDPPFGTWREYAKWSGQSIAEVLDHHGGRCAADDFIDDPYEFYSTTRPIYDHFLELDIPRNFRCLGSDKIEELQVCDGPSPGNDFCGVWLSSNLAVSCLQYMLDDMNLGIRLVPYKDS